MKILLLITALFVSACGVKGDPMPPEKRPMKEKMTPTSEVLDEDTGKNTDKSKTKKAE